jgi:hypothetical protein
VASKEYNYIMTRLVTGLLRFQFITYMKVARLFFLLGFSAAFGACSSNTSSETTTATKPPASISAAYDSAVADTSTVRVGSDSLPVNVPATEYAHPPQKVPTTGNQ